MLCLVLCSAAGVVTTLAAEPVYEGAWERESWRSIIVALAQTGPDSTFVTISLRAPRSSSCDRSTRRPTSDINGPILSAVIAAVLRYRRRSPRAQEWRNNNAVDLLENDILDGWAYWGYGLNHLRCDQHSCSSAESIVHADAPLRIAGEVHYNLTWLREGLLRELGSTHQSDRWRRVASAKLRS